MDQRFAYIVGCDEYQHFPSLNFAESDAHLVRNTLLTYCDYEEANVEVQLIGKELHEGPSAFLESLQRFVDRAERGDTVLFYFAGHGLGKEGKGYLLLPSTVKERLESTSVPLTSVSAILRRPHNFCLRVFDACHSGYDARGEHDGLGDYREFARALDEDVVKDLSWATLASCRPEDRSYEDHATGHGIFTQNLCEVIRQVPPGQVVEAGKVYADLYRRMEEITVQRHRPQLPVKNTYLVGPDIFAVRNQTADNLGLNDRTNSPAGTTDQRRGEALLERDLKAYHRLATMTARYCMFSRWSMWTENMLRPRPSLGEGEAESLESFVNSYISAILPGTREDFETALRTLFVRIEHLRRFFLLNANLEDGRFYPDKFYNRGPFNPNYDRDADRYNAWEEGVFYLVEECTKAANWFADEVREEVDPEYFVEGGRFGIHAGPTERFQSEYSAPTYTSEQRSKQLDQAMQELNSFEELVRSKQFWRSLDP